jgi:hypothetical protein
MEPSGTLHPLLYLSHVLTLQTQNEIANDPETHGAMFVPFILGSDKTTVSVATGHNEYYPLYASIGNVQNQVRRAHRNAVSLLGFLAIPKGETPLRTLLVAAQHQGAPEC